MSTKTKLHNSLSRKKEPFSPIEKGHVRMYNCGPTVYHFAHIGNMRAYMLADVLRRWFEYQGMTVTQVMNITDVGHMVDDAEDGLDKMESAAKREKKTPEEIAAFYTEQFFADLETLNMLPATSYPRATDHIEEMVENIQKLIDNGHAYVVDGSVYFDVTTFPDYGKLSGNTLEKLQAGARVPVKSEKRNPEDFALWINKPEHIMKWPAPWSVGYPGWHIECSAMGMKYLGEQFDIHTGGDDNKFPHHEDEIAQAEGASGKQPFVNTWLHVGPLKVDGEKMSKSKGNFYTLRDLLAKGYSWRAIRYVLLASHYRQDLNLTDDAFEAATSAVDRLDTFLASMDRADGEDDVSAVVDEAKKAMEKALANDLVLPEVFGALFEMIKSINKLSPTSKSATDAKALVLEMDRILGLDLGQHTEIPDDVRDLAEERQQARKEKDFNRADVLRDDIEHQGWIVEDIDDGYLLKPTS